MGPGRTSTVHGCPSRWEGCGWPDTTTTNKKTTAHSNRKPWRHNESKKRWITRSQVDPVHCLEQASVLCPCTLRTSRSSWINERSNNSAQLPMGSECAVCSSVQPDVITNVKTPFFLDTQGPCGSVRRCSNDTVTHDTECTGVTLSDASAPRFAAAAHRREAPCKAAKIEGSIPSQMSEKLCLQCSLSAA